MFSFLSKVFLKNTKKINQIVKVISQCRHCAYVQLRFNEYIVVRVSRMSFYFGEQRCHVTTRHSHVTPPPNFLLVLQWASGQRLVSVCVWTFGDPHWLARVGPLLGRGRRLRLVTNMDKRKRLAAMPAFVCAVLSSCVRVSSLGEVQRACGLFLLSRLIKWLCFACRLQRHLNVY